MTYEGLFSSWKQHVRVCLCNKVLEHAVYLQYHMAKYFIGSYAADEHRLFQTKACGQHDTVRWFSICSNLESYFRRQTKAILSGACGTANTEECMIFRSDPNDSFWILQNWGFYRVTE